uniref:Si:ch211-224l10.4 n=1 Tax=Cyprinus carpio TaxID=7962 RepID=A0A8C1YTV6_CYPCA
MMLHLDLMQKTSGIPLSRKLCYAIGGKPYQMTGTARGFFMQIFLLDVVKMGAFSASIILFLGRAWDAISDPLIGYAVSKSGQTRTGKLIPWIVFSMPLGVLSYCYHVPYSSLNIRAYLTGALVLGMLYFLCCLVLFLGVKEQLAPLSKLDRINVPYLTAIKMIVGHTPYVRLVFGFLFASLAFQLAQGNFALFCTHATKMGAYFQHLVLILLTAATISIPVWQTVLVTIGKKNTIFIGLSFYIPALIVISLVKSSLPAFIMMSMLAGTSLAAFFLLPYVVDDFKVKNPSCQDLEPLFYSCYGFFSKLGGDMSVGVSTLVLYFAGYKPGACKHNPEVIFSLWVLFAPVPICLLLISLMIFCFYPINEEQQRKIQDALREAGYVFVFVLA